MGDLGSEKQQNSTSNQQDNRVTGGNDAYGGEHNVITVGSDELAGKALATVKDVIANELTNRLNEQQANADLYKVFATQNLQPQDSTSQRLSELAQTKITDGANLTNKTTVIAIAIAGAILLLPALKGK